MPIIAGYGGWRRRREHRRPRRPPVRWSLILPAYLARLLVVPWWTFETWRDELAVLRQHGLRLTADELRGLLGRLRHPAGVRELVSAVRRQDLDCDPDGIALLEELAAQGEAPPVQRPRSLRSSFPAFRRPDWLGSPELLSDRVLDQIALISEARLRGADALAGSTSAKLAHPSEADTPVSPNLS